MASRSFWSLDPREAARPSFSRTGGAALQLLAKLKHPPNGELCALAQWLWQSDFRFHVQERVVRFFERVHLHEPAFATEAVICRAGNERLVRNFFTEAVQ